MRTVYYGRLCLLLQMYFAGRLTCGTKKPEGQMGVKQCPDCSGMVSDALAKCPHCGRPTLADGAVTFAAQGGVALAGRGTEASVAPSSAKVERPPSVSTAVKILYACMALGILGSPLTFPPAVANVAASGSMSQNAAWGLMVVGSLLGLGLAALFINLIGKGRNWARIVFLVVCFLGIPFFLINLVQTFGQAPVPSLLSILSSVLQVSAAVLLLKKESVPFFKRSSAT